MKNPFIPNIVNDVVVYKIMDSIGYYEMYNGDKIDNVKVDVKVNRKTWALYADYSIIHEGNGSIPLMRIELCKIRDPLDAYRTAGGYSIGKFDKDEYLDGLEEYLSGIKFPYLALPILRYIKFPESLHRKLFRDDINEYVRYLVCNGEEHYTVDYWLSKYQKQLTKLKSYLSKYNSTLQKKYNIKKKGAIKIWRKEKA